MASANRSKVAIVKCDEKMVYQRLIVVLFNVNDKSCFLFLDERFKWTVLSVPSLRRMRGCVSTRTHPTQTFPR